MAFRMDRPTRGRVAAAVTAALLAAFAVPALAQDPGSKGGGQPGKGKGDPVKLGLVINEPKAFQGYTLLAPMTSTKTYLIDMQGRVVRTWESDCTPALSAYLLENGNLLRPG